MTSYSTWSNNRRDHTKYWGNCKIRCLSEKVEHIPPWGEEILPEEMGLWKNGFRKKIPGKTHGKTARLISGKKIWAGLTSLID